MTSSRKLLNMRMGRVGGNWGILDADFHFCVQRKENTPMYGQPRMTSGREVNVFSIMSAETC